MDYRFTGWLRILDKQQFWIRHGMMNFCVCLCPDLTTHREEIRSSGQWTIWRATQRNDCSCPIDCLPPRRGTYTSHILTRDVFGGGRGRRLFVTDVFASLSSRRYCVVVVFVIVVIIWHNGVSKTEPVKGAGRRTEM